MILFCLFVVYLCWIWVVILVVSVLDLVFGYGCFVLVDVFDCAALFVLAFGWVAWFCCLVGVVWWFTILVAGCDWFVCVLVLVFILGCVVLFLFNSVVMMHGDTVCFALLVLCSCLVFVGLLCYFVYDCVGYLGLFVLRLRDIWLIILWY